MFIVAPNFVIVETKEVSFDDGASALALTASHIETQGK